MKLELSKWYKILAPRPVVLISTVNSDGISNAAPFSFVMPVSSKPPIVSFASAAGHDTVKNIKQTKNFVINIPGREMLKQLWTCAKKFDRGVSEIKESGLTEIKSGKVSSPGIAESAARIECSLLEMLDYGDHAVVMGNVLEVTVKDELFKNGKYDIMKANPLTHIGGPEFGLLGTIADIKKEK